jgi:outer membrane protein assembly factor BamB
MMRRRTALTLSLGFLASCTHPQPKIVGTQIPVLPVANGMDVAVDAPAVRVPPAAALASWPQSLVNAAHAPGNIAGPTGLVRHWSASVGESGGYRQPLQASPLIAGGFVFTMDAAGAVSAFAVSDGSRAWRTTTQPKHASEQNIGGGIAYDSGTVYASTGYGDLLALSADNGKILWRQKLDFPARTAPLVAGGLVALVVQNDLLLTFDATSGTPGWRFTGTPVANTNAFVAIAGAPAYADGILVAGFSTGTLAALDANSGAPLWEQNLASSYGSASPLDFSDIVAAPVIANGVVYAIGLGNTAMAVDLHSGATVWTHSAAGTLPFYVAGEFVYVLDKSQMLYAVHADDGLVSWSLQLPLFHNPKKQKDPIQWTGPVMVNGTLLATNDWGQIAVVDPVSGQIKSCAKIAAPADMAPIAADGLLLQLTRDATLTAYA